MVHFLIKITFFILLLPSLGSTQSTDLHLLDRESFYIETAIDSSLFLRLDSIELSVIGKFPKKEGEVRPYFLPEIRLEQDQKVLWVSNYGQSFRILPLTKKGVAFFEMQPNTKFYLMYRYHFFVKERNNRYELWRKGDKQMYMEIDKETALKIYNEPDSSFSGYTFDEKAYKIKEDFEKRTAQ